MIERAVRVNSCVNGGGLLGTCYQVGMRTRRQDPESIPPVAAASGGVFEFRRDCKTVSLNPPE